MEQMVSLGALWLPIVLSAVVVFAASAVIHMVFTYHQRDFSALPNESRVRDALRAENLAQGSYVFPYAATMKEMGSPEMLEKFRQGPVGMLQMFRNGPPPMPRLLAQWFLFSLAVGVFAAYLAGRTLAAGTPYLAVFRVVGVVVFLAYAGSEVPRSIWMGQRWITTTKNLIDGLIYGLLSAGVFGWLWPR